MVPSRAACAVVAAITVFTGAAPSALANWRCGYDRYGYHPPNFWGCPEYSRDNVYDAVSPPYPDPAGAFYLVPQPAPYCFLDTGYDLRVHRVCIQAW